MNFFTIEALLGLLTATALVALALEPKPQYSYASVRATLLAQDLLEAVENDGSLLNAACGLADGDAGSRALLKDFLDKTQASAGAKCVWLKAGEESVSSECSSGKKIVLRRLLFDGNKFFFLEAEVSY
jgi:hypothetical protein